MATNTFAALINENAKDGWRFHSLETINTTETNKTGCIFNKQVLTTEHTIYAHIREGRLTTAEWV